MKRSTESEKNRNHDLLMKRLSANRLKSLSKEFNSLDSDEESDEGKNSPFDTTGIIIDGGTLEETVFEDEFVFEDEKI